MAEQIAEIESSDDDLDEDSTIIDVIRRILHSGAASTRVSMGNAVQQFRLSGRHTGREEDSDSSTDDDTQYVYDARRQYRSRIPKPPANPDTSVIDKSELKQQMLYESGALNPAYQAFGRSFKSIPGFLPAKEVGVFSQNQSMTHGQIVSACKGFIVPSSGSPITLARVRDKFFCGVYNQEGDRFMSACQDAKIRISDTTNGQWRRIKSINALDVGWSILDVDFSHDGNYIIYSSWSQNIHLCNICGDEDVHQALFLAPDRPYRTAVFSLRFTPDDSEIIAGANNGTIFIFDRERNERTLMIDAHEDDLSSVCLASESGEIIYSGGEDGPIKIWDRRLLRETNPQPIGQLAGHFDSITHIDSRQDGRYLLTNSKDQSIKLWDIRKLATTAGIEATRRSVSRQDWDYRWHSYVGKVVKKKLPGDCSVMTYYGHSVARTLIRARFSPRHTTGQRFIYCGDGMGRVIIYNLLTGQVERTLDGGHSREVVRDVSWHPYENNIVSSGWDGKLLRWENRGEES